MNIYQPDTIQDRVREANVTNTNTNKNKNKDPRPVLEIACPRCTRPGTKAGRRRTGHGSTQRFHCAPCDRHFSASPLPGRRYAPAIVVEAVTAYNFGRTLTETQRHISSRYRRRVPETTIHSWTRQFASVCTFSQYRKRYALSEDHTIQSRTFSHQQEYKFKFHRLKTNILCKTRHCHLRRYLWHIADNCPNHLFQQGGARCSDANLPTLTLNLLRKDTLAVPLARLGLMIARDRRGRHEAVQRVMLGNDSATIAVEVPVYLHPHETPDLKLTAPLTGHIDILQVRFDRVWILDFKPDARKERRAKYQLYLYARALSTRTGIPLSRFGLAYFDDRDYFEVSIGEADVVTNGPATQAQAPAR